MSIGTVRTATSPMSAREFRSFQEGCPDHERWELIRGVPVMMVPPTIAHQRIADNLTRLLNDALAKHDPARFAVSRSGVELGDAALERVGENYRPEPDVIVIDTDYEPRQRFVDRAYLLAEIVSDTDNEPVAGTKERWIAIKRSLYLAHPHCETVIMIEPDRVEVRMDMRAKDVWTSLTLTNLGDKVIVPRCGLQCAVADLYEGTPLRASSGLRA